MKTHEILNIKFVDSELDELLNELKKGGFIILPSGPGLATLNSDVRYKVAVQNSDYALPDSGFMIILAKIYYGTSIKKISGAKFIRYFIKNAPIKEKGKLFLIDPNIRESNKNRVILRKHGIDITTDYQYISPMYRRSDEILDEELIMTIGKCPIKPKYILINLGSGVQEPLGYFLKKALNYNPTIICSGAAISFLTGAQVKIPKWIDMLYLGWFARIISNPVEYVGRYLRALNLVKVFFRFKRGSR
jgi:N-acetylglucosaminyldiphosphoundecaprenol N-acetyl-beta-D-mannosaminyltransferase